jgi:hypothetical protein
MKLDDFAEDAARSTASKFNRRGFLARLGVGLAGVGAGELALRSPHAVSTIASGHAIQLLADDPGVLNCCGCSHCGDSTTCGSGNPCPSGTCNCGTWYMCSSCGGFLQQATDCCAGCSGGCSCGPDGRPTCFYPAEWSGGCNGHSRIKCRRLLCTRHPC